MPRTTQRMLRILAFFVAASLIWTGCKKETDQAELDMKVDDELVKEVSDVIITLPSPLELASLLKKSEAAYNGTLLNSPENRDKYTDAFHQAFNMGAYGADLGYVAYYDKPQEATNYLNAINILGTNLQVLGAFDTDLLKSIEKNISNQDSLLRLITIEFDKAETHLNNANRPEASTAILAGGWIEGLYLATQINKAAPNELIRERIGETKLSLNSLLQLLYRFQEQGAEFKGLYDQLLKLRELYDKVEITYGGQASTAKGGGIEGKDVKTPKSTELKTVDGTQSVETGMTSTVKISDETVKAITDMVATIRNQYVAVK